MFNSKHELFEITRKRWPEKVIILDSQPDIDNCVHTDTPLFEIYQQVLSSINSYDNFDQLANWSFHQAVDKLGRRKYKKFERNLRFKEVSFVSFHTMMMRNLVKDKWSDDWKDEREIYLALPIK